MGTRRLCGPGVYVFSPPMHLKAHALGGPFVNWFGYGIATPLAGYGITGVSMTWRSGSVIGACSICILGLYFLAQSYQESDDRRRGDNTLVARRGTEAVLQLGHLCLRCGVVSILIGAALGYLPRILLVLGYPSWSLDRPSFSGVSRLTHMIWTRPIR